MRFTMKFIRTMRHLDRLPQVERLTWWLLKEWDKHRASATLQPSLTPISVIPQEKKHCQGSLKQFQSLNASKHINMHLKQRKPQNHLFVHQIATALSHCFTGDIPCIWLHQQWSPCNENIYSVQEPGKFFKSFWFMLPNIQKEPKSITQIPVQGQLCKVDTN